MTTRETFRGRLGHPNLLLGQTEAFGDSDRGLRYFARKGCDRVDGNALLSGPDTDGVPVLMNTHYVKFLRHGFVLRHGGKISRDLPLSHFGPKDLRTKFWTRRGHYQMDTILNRIRLAFSLGMDYELEIKEHVPLEVVKRTWVAILRIEEEYPGRKVIVKVYNNRPGKVAWLRPWSEVHAPTLMTTHTRRRRKVPAELEQYVDEFRGVEPRWVA